jgi:DNA transformation protein
VSNFASGHRLYVNVSAAEARRRLDGRGLGVRKVHSAGSNQAVVIHTAEGRHLEQLQAVFGDVGWSTTEVGLSPPIESLRNLGPATGIWLREAGVRTIADLRKMGAVAAYQAVRRREPTCGLNLLWALAAGLTGREWRELSDAEKSELRHELEAAAAR